MQCIGVCDTENISHDEGTFKGIVDASEMIFIVDCKLLLRPLDGVSDEHKILILKNHGYSDLERHTTESNCKQYDFVFNWRVLKNEIPYYTYQHFMSLGYAVPLWFGINHWANGKTAIELGIAVSTPTSSKGM